MREGRFPEEQMVSILHETGRDLVAQVAKWHGMSEQTIHTSRQRFSGMNADTVCQYHWCVFTDKIRSSGDEI